MKKYIIIISILIAGVNGHAQSNFEAVLTEIEANNTTLQALKQQTEAQKLGNKTGIYLQNPEFGFSYLWGNSAVGNNETDISLTQSFDFPTAYHYKSAIAKGRNRQADFEYLQQHKVLMLEVSKVCADLVYLNALKVELDKRLRHSQLIADAYQQRLDAGDADILERNKSKLNLLNARKSSESNDVELSAAKLELVRLNGGKPIRLTGDVVLPYFIAQNFEQWYAVAKQNNPDLQFITQDVELSKKQIKLNRAMSLPKLSAGYVRESMGSDIQQGAAFGISIPLWENKNTVKQAKAQTIALQNVENDAQLQFYNTLKIQYNKAISLQNIVDDYKEIMQTMNSGDLLRKALDKGQISLIEYMMELSIYYEAVDNSLTAQRDLLYVLMELKQWEGSN